MLLFTHLSLSICLLSVGKIDFGDDDDKDKGNKGKREMDIRIVIKIKIVRNDMNYL